MLFPEITRKPGTKSPILTKEIFISKHKWLDIAVAVHYHLFILLQRIKLFATVEELASCFP